MDWHNNCYTAMCDTQHTQLVIFFILFESHFHLRDKSTMLFINIGKKQITNQTKTRTWELGESIVSATFAAIHASAPLTNSVTWVHVSPPSTSFFFRCRQKWLTGTCSRQMFIALKYKPACILPPGSHSHTHIERQTDTHTRLLY